LWISPYNSHHKYNLRNILTVAVANGNLWSWGGNGGVGELGTGKADKNVTLPIQSKLSNVKQAYAGGYHTVALQGISIMALV
jgi:alpha-tubulin suppressor-like RCC1 family protein